MTNRDWFITQLRSPKLLHELTKAMVQNNMDEESLNDLYQLIKEKVIIRNCFSVPGRIFVVYYTVKSTHDVNG